MVGRFRPDSGMVGRFRPDSGMVGRFRPDSGMVGRFRPDSGMSVRFSLRRRPGPGTLRSMTTTEVPSPRLVAAQMRLGILTAESVPLWAAHWLVQGFDGEAV